MEFTDWISGLQNSQKTVLVEGKKDKKALEELGVKNIITLSGPLFKVIESIHDEIVILTDLDREGKKLYSKLKHNLQKRKVKIDHKFREYLFNETKVTNIEGLSRYAKKRGII